MNSLRVTNFLLMVIAICLVYQCVKFGAVASDAAKPKSAGTGVMPVRIVGTANINVASVYGYTWTAKASDYQKGSIPVYIENPSTDVNISSCTAAFPLSVSIDPLITGPLDVNVIDWSAGTLDVEVDDTSTIPVEIKNYKVPVEIKNIFPIPVTPQ